MAHDWLEDFVEHTSYGETPAKIMRWVGIATLAGALRRKVFIDQLSFQWSPNFYLLIVAPPGVVKKSTSIGLGLKMLRRIEGIDFGPQMVTWQQMITHMAGTRETVLVDGEDFEMSCCTVSLSEFGSFFDPSDRNMITNLTDMWDGKLETVVKETKTSGTDEIVNPWLNILACTTPKWIASNFSANLIGEGFGSRPIYVYADTPQKSIAYPKRNMMSGQDMQAFKQRENELTYRLGKIAQYAGEYRMTEEAYQWGEAWYADYMQKQMARGNSAETGVYARLQTHLHKVAMVLSAAREKFPVIDVQEMIDADAMLQDLGEDVTKVFSFVGQSAITGASRELVELLTKRGQMPSETIYREYFYKSMTKNEFNEAVQSAQAAGLVDVNGELIRTKK